MSQDADSNAPIVTRFAPSPTGLLHVGGARTALYNWAFARGRGGKFIIRLEDTDQTRSSEASAIGMLRDLAWLGLDWDEGPYVESGDDDKPVIVEKGEHGPYRQSQRLGLYNAAIQELINAGLTTEEENGAVRFTMPKEAITFHDEVRGDVTTPADQIDDFIIRKADGFPTYHLAVVVDDHAMGVNHVLRAQEHLSNTPKHIALQRALGYPQPTYAHFGLIFNPDGSKMSKRDKAKAARKAALAHLDGKSDAEREAWMAEVAKVGAMTNAAASQLNGANPREDFNIDEVEAYIGKLSDSVDIAQAVAHILHVELPEIDVHDFRWSGYLPEVLCNYLSLLGWNPGGDREKFDLPFLCKTFSLDRVGKGDSKFDRDKLAAFNQDAIKALAPAVLCDRVWKLPRNGSLLDNSDLFSGKDDLRFVIFCEAYRERSKTLRDPLLQGRFFFYRSESETPDYNNKGVKKALFKGDPPGIKVLQEFVGTLKGIEPGDGFGARAQQAIEAFCAEREIGNIGKLAQPIRVAVSGTPVTPPIDATLEILGKDETIKRVEHLLAMAPRD